MQYRWVGSVHALLDADGAGSEGWRKGIHHIYDRLKRNKALPEWLRRYFSYSETLSRTCSPRHLSQETPNPNQMIAFRACLPSGSEIAARAKSPVGDSTLDMAAPTLYTR